MKLKGKKTYIIAEAGVNHNGKISIAKKLVTAAKNAGANAVKFQSFITSNLVTKDSSMAEYQIKNTGKNNTQYEMLKKLSLKNKDYLILKKFCKKKKIDFLTSVFDEQSLDFVQNRLKNHMIKIPSGELNNFFILDLLKKNKTIILSTGMSSLKEIAISINRIFKLKIYTFKKGLIKVNHKLLNKIKKNIFILHCVTDYPVKNEFANLKAIKFLKKNLKLNIGYSDHTKDILAPIIAVSYGAKIIEKHLTLSKKMSGPDHKASLEEDEFKKMCLSIKKAEQLIGEGDKKIEKCEIKNIKVARKSIVAKKYIKKGEKFSLTNMTAKRPFNGISPDKLDLFLNKVSKKNYKKDDLIS